MTFVIFIGASVVFANLIALGFLNIDSGSPAKVAGSVTGVVSDLGQHGLGHAAHMMTIGVASCVLAYSGIESVLQTAGLVEGWRQISRAYWFLALTVGIVTPVVSALALSAPIDFRAHEGDLITHWATVVGNVPFGVVVGLLGSVILIMAVNTAYVASSELLERLAHRYRFNFLLETNRRASLYRIHLLNATLYTAVILITRGSQQILAEMYAVGLLASFSINIGCLLLYRYFRGTAQIRDYYTSRAGDARPRGHPGELLRLPRLAQALRHRPLGERRRDHPRRRRSVLAPLRPGEEGDSPQRLSDGAGGLAGGNRRAATLLLPPPGRARAGGSAG